jgi:hypothetical protein
MLDNINSSAISDPQDLTLGELLALVDIHPDLPLVFHYGGLTVRPGYHVTEVKAGQFAALDCGANAESWDELFVQLWDVDEAGRTHMTAGKFARIIRKVADHVGLDMDARLTFEVSDGMVPMQLFRATRPAIDEMAMNVALLPRAASCKPRDRWFKDSQQAGQTGAAGPSACCG